ncbi:putative NAD-dependent oxidoreductase [Acaryochloris thomasi RCC1774]|uniref:3-dehydrosphinganine reductase n=1 Tax=Acaryochloris thomasi RCC1774 TaxID=1764569 RepID=A0A2W1JIE8_9CYAN|nr:putative NAD-dependent oxidoreductase [Acaryochloris thomasi RCC1774]
MLAQQGASLTLIARTASKLEETRQAIERQGLQNSQQVLTLTADVSDRAQVEKAIGDAIATLGPPDLLITCAGIAHCDYFQNLSLEMCEQAMAVNYFGSLYCIRAVLPAMEQRRQGHIVVVSSGVGLIGLYGYSAYSPTKFALRGLAESLRGELKPLGIGISIVYPPDTDTPQLAQENLTKPLETQRISSTAKTWTAEQVAHTILSGLKNKKFMIAPGQEMTVLARLHSLISPLLHRYFDGIVAKTRRERQSHD